MENMNLVDYLKKCDDAYYNSSNPVVSDDTYDALVETLRRLDPDHPYLQKVGAKVKSNKVGRLIPMGTLRKRHKDEEVKDWLDSEGGLILVSPKYDGFAVELVYKYGVLVSASTRGDGNVGEDVFLATKSIKNIPQKLLEYPKETVIVRGEAIIPTKNHEQIKSLGYTAMRNAVPGIVRSNRAEALQYVDFVAYEFIDGEIDRIYQRDLLKKYFTVEDYRAYPAEDFISILSRREELRATTYTYELDGVVLKTNEIKEDDLLCPDHMISWKYKSNRETTTLRGVEYQMGVTGYFTPIGIFDEVEFQGAKLTRASLGNITRMVNEFDGLTVGSIVEVSRRGDIIPYIESLVMTEESQDRIEYPIRCPHCRSLLEWDDKEPHCTNKSCPETLRLRIIQFVKSIGIKGIGDKLIRSLIDTRAIESICDIYLVTPEQIFNIPRQGYSAVEKWKSLQDKRLSPLELLSSYPFINLGEKVWKTVLSKFEYADIMDITKEELESANLKGIGESKINDIVTQVAMNRQELMWLGYKHSK